MQLGKVIKRIREEKGLRKCELSRLSGLAESSITLIEQGKRMPKNSTIRTLCNAMKVSESLVLLYAIEIDEIPEEKRYVFSKALDVVIALANNNNMLFGRYGEK